MYDDLEVLEIIKKTKESKDKFLNLEDFFVSKIPKELFELVDLEYLGFPFTKQTYLPKEIKNLKNLNTLSIFGVKIYSLPIEIKELKNISDLRLSIKNINNFPTQIRHLKKLKKLHISGQGYKINKFLSKLSCYKDLKLIQIGLSVHYDYPLYNITKKIKNFSNIEKLYISGKLINKLPKELFLLKNLTHLIFINTKILNMNQSFFSSKSLKYIYIDKKFISVDEFRLLNSIYPNVKIVSNFKEIQN
ncbi:MAG: hypothetical protein U0354_20550 [Candidatus Sericytochromatia bacterium]